MPTSLRSIVWNGLVVLDDALVYEPVTKGTFWPTTIFASSLSNVTRLAVDRMLVPEVAWIAWATVPSVRLVSAAMLKIDFHCRPTSSALLASTSTTTDSTSSCARRVSSSSMAARSSRYKGSAAVTINAFDAGSAWMKPPVDGAADAVVGAVVSCEVVDEPLALDDDADDVKPPGAADGAALALALLPTRLASVAKAARSTVARRAASAYFR